MQFNFSEVSYFHFRWCSCWLSWTWPFFFSSRDFTPPVWSGWSVTGSLGRKYRCQCFLCTDTRQLYSYTSSTVHGLPPDHSPALLEQRCTWTGTATFQVKLSESQSTARTERWLCSSKKRDWIVELISATACSAFPTICILKADFPVVTYTFITSRLRLSPTHPRWDSIWGSWHDWSRVGYLAAMCWCQCTSDSSDWTHPAAEVEGADQDLHCLTWQKSIPPKKLFWSICHVPTTVVRQDKQAECCFHTHHKSLPTWTRHPSEPASCPKEFLGELQKTTMH